MKDTRYGCSVCGMMGGKKRRRSDRRKGADCALIYSIFEFEQIFLVQFTLHVHDGRTGRVQCHVNELLYEF